MNATIHEVLEYGPICASDEETGCLVTVNGAYANLWVPCPDGGYDNRDCVACEADMYGTTAAAMWEFGKVCFAAWLDPDQEDDPDND